MSRSEFLENKKSDIPAKSIDWFTEPCMKWFLSKDDVDPALTRSSWFNNLIGVTKKTTKRIFRRRISFEKVKIVIAKNHDIKEQYYELRERLYRSKLGFKSYDGHENAYDKVGDVVVALYKNEIVAGARLDFSNLHRNLMYNDNFENNGFTYNDVIRRIDPNFVDTDLYVEMCGLVIEERMVKPDFFAHFFGVIVDHTINKKARYVVGISYPKFCDNVRAVFDMFRYDAMVFEDMIFKPKSSYGKNKYDLTFCPIVIKNY